MADETEGVDGVNGGSDESRECMPCAGSGQLISNLGGSPKDVTCPWCSGTGRRQAGIDAQAAWRERQQGEAATEGEAPTGEKPAEEPPTEGAASPAAPAGEPAGG